MQRLFNYITESRHELAKVTWPTRQQAVRLTIVVVLFSLALSAFIGGLDFVFTLVLQRVILKG